MKFLFLYMICFSAIAGGFAKKIEIENKSITRVFTSIRSCGSNCLELPDNFNREFHKTEEILKQDINNPIVTKSEAETCVETIDDPSTTEIDESKTIAQDCQEKLEAKTCADPDEGAVKILDAGSEEVYCTKTTFPMIGSGSFHVVEDAALKAAYKSSQAAKAADEAAIQAALKAANCGKRVKARMLVQNAGKSLNNGQKKQLVQTYSDIIQLLDAGSLSTARAEILVVTPDGVLVTTSDKTALVAELDGCL